MLNRGVFNYTISLILSAMMAFPAHVWAKDDATVLAENSMEAVPALIQDVMIGNDRAQVATVLVPEEVEQELVERLVTANPDRVQLHVAGPEDAVLKTVTKTGYLKRVTTFIFGEPEQTPIVQADATPKTLKGKLLDKFKKIRDYTKTERYGLMTSIFFYGAVNAGYTMYTSSSVVASTTVFATVFTWTMILTNNPWLYEKIVSKGGDRGLAVGKLIGNLFGHELNDMEKRVYEVLGTFVITWGMAAIQAAFIMGCAGTLFGSGWLAMASAIGGVGIAGIVNNYTFWDAFFLRLHKEGKMSTQAIRKYFKYIIRGGGFVEISGYLNIPGVPVVAAAVTMGAVLFQMFSPHKQDAMSDRFKDMSQVFSDKKPGGRMPGESKASYVSRKANDAILKTTVKCQLALMGAPPKKKLPPMIDGNTAREIRLSWDDIQ